MSAWGTADFEAVLCDELAGLDPSRLPLQEGLSAGSHAMGERLGLMVLGAGEGEGVIRVRVGLFFSSIIAGCSCADDPTPVDEVNEYCEVRIAIDKATGEARVTLLGEG